MKSCLKIPRILLPDGGYEKWAVIACDQFTSDRAYWQRVEQTVGDAPSTYRFILPEAFLGEDDSEAIENIKKEMYAALESGALSKLERGIMYIERSAGGLVRQGIVCAIDLEAYTMGKGEVSPIRSSEEVVPARLPARVAVRRSVPLEFPHAVLFYKDKKDKVNKFLKNEDLELIYDFDLMEDGGKIKGYFVPEYTALSVVKAMQSRTEPTFAVADGNHSVAAAKAYWEELKPTLSEREQRNHPARFMLVELENLYSEAVVFHPIHRIVKGVEVEAFCDFFSRSVKCKRKGGLLYPALPSGAKGVQKCDELCEEFIYKNGGRIDYIHGEKELLSLVDDESVGVVLETLKKDDFFKQLESGGNFPKKTFSLGEAREKRYYLEGREISYE